MNKSDDGIKVDGDLLPHLSTSISNNKPFISNQSEGIFWIINEVIGIHYKTHESSIDIDLRIFSIDMDTKTIHINNPICKLEGCVEFVKGGFEISADFDKNVLVCTGTACFREIIGEGEWRCLPKKSWILMHW